MPGIRARRDTVLGIGGGASCHARFARVAHTPHEAELIASLVDDPTATAHVGDRRLEPVRYAA